jgi:glycosyltransferase involved in cell wall biosynthesis
MILLDQSAALDGLANSSGRETIPRLSIVVPVYRSADCLQALIGAIADALKSSCPEYEVILVNDCSPDGAWA